MTIPYQLLLIIPFVIIGFLVGFRRGWNEEGLTTLGLIITLFFFSNPGRTGLLGVLINRVVQAFAVFFSTLLGVEFEGRTLVEVGNPTLFQFIGFIIFVILSYLAGSAFGRRKGLTRGGYFLGGVIGALNVFLVGSQLISFINEFFPDFFQRTVTVTSETGNVLREYLPSIFALLAILFLIVFFIQLPKRRQ